MAYVCCYKLIKIMRRLTEQEKKMYDRATKFATSKQLFMLSWWDIFCPKKREKLHKCIISGIHWDVAYTIAKNVW